MPRKSILRLCVLALVVASFATPASPLASGSGALKKQCRSARTAAQWAATCPKIGRRGITVVGSRTQPVIRGSGGNDTIFTGSGTHTTYARAGNDRVVAGTGANRIFAGPGNDLIEARNGFRDYVGCGSGHDIAIGDDIDVIRSCSVVIRHPTGSLRFPVRVGSPHDLGDGWRVKVVSVTPYANEVVLKADKSNRPPPAGKQYFLVKISASLRGKQSRYLRATQRFRAVTHSKATVYSSFEDSCGILPALDLETYDREVLPGRRLVGNVCWTVKSSDAKKLVMFAAPLVTGERVFFALH